MNDIYKIIAELLAQGGGIALLIGAGTTLIRFVINCATGKERLI